MRSAAKPYASPSGSAGGSNSVSPFFPDLAATRTRPTREEAKESGSGSGSSSGSRHGARPTPQSQQSKRGLGGSYSTESLHFSSSPAGASVQQRKRMQSSVSAATLPSFSVSHAAGAAQATHPLSSVHPYSGPWTHLGAGPAPAPSNSSAKLASKMDRWASVEELLDHSHAVIAAGGRMAPSGANGATGGHTGTPTKTAGAAASLSYDPSSFSTFSALDDAPLATAQSTPLQRKALAAAAAAAHRPSSPLGGGAVARSPFATQAPPPAPLPPPATWGGFNPTPTPGLVRFQSEPALREDGAAAPMLRRLEARLRQMEREEKNVQVHPSVLFQAGMGPGPDDAGSDAGVLGEEEEGSAAMGSSTAMTAAPISPSHSRSGAAGTKDGTGGAGSKGAVERLWAQHQRMMSAARKTLPLSLRSGGSGATQRHVVAAVQSLHPRTLLRIFSPQLHVLSVSLSALEKLVRADDKQKAGLLTHLQAHQQLVLDVLVQFAAVSCETLQGDDTDQTDGEQQGTDALAAAAVAEGQALDGAVGRSGTGGETARLMTEALRIEATQGSSSLAALMFKPSESSASNSAASSSPLHHRSPQQAGRSVPAHAQQQQQRQHRQREAYESDGEESFTSGAGGHGVEASSLDQSFDGALASPPLPPNVFDPLSSSSSSSSSLGAVAPSTIHFGNSHAWSLERWRQRILALRAREIEDEHNYILCVEILAGLSTLRAREMEELASAPPPAASTSAAGGRSASNADSYAAVHGSFDSHRNALQERLDALKVRLDPTYAAKFVRHHQQILSIEEVELQAREEEQGRGAASGSTGSSGIGGGLTPNVSAGSLSLQMSLLRRGEASHSTNASAYTSSRDGGRAHRLPHSTWLSTSTPSSGLLALSLDDAPRSDGPDPAPAGAGADSSVSPSASASSLRSSRIRSLVHLENVHTDAAEKQAQLLQEHRSLLERFRALQTIQQSYKRQADESAAMHAAQLGEIEARLREETSARLALHNELEGARYECVEKDVKVEQLYAQIAQLSYTVKQLQVTYTQHALYKPAVIDCAAGQTDEADTGAEQGGWDEHGMVARGHAASSTAAAAVPSGSAHTAAVAAAVAAAAVAMEQEPAQLSEDESAVLVAAGLAHAHPSVQLAALAAAAAATPQHVRDRLASAKRRPSGPGPASSSAGSTAGGGSPSAVAAAASGATHSPSAAPTAAPLQRRNTVSLAGASASVSGASSPSVSPSPTPSPTGLRRSAGSSRRTQSMSSVAASDAAALAEKARKAAAYTDRDRHSQRDLPALEEEH